MTNRRKSTLTKDPEREGPWYLCTRPCHLLLPGMHRVSPAAADGACSVGNQTEKRRCRFKLAIRGRHSHNPSTYIRLGAGLTLISLNQPYCCSSTCGVLPRPSFAWLKRSFSDGQNIGQWTLTWQGSIASDDRHSPLQQGPTASRGGSAGEVKLRLSQRAAWDRQAPFSGFNRSQGSFQ